MGGAAGVDVVVEAVVVGAEVAAVPGVGAEVGVVEVGVNGRAAEVWRPCVYFPFSCP